MNLNRPLQGQRRPPKKAGGRYELKGKFKSKFRGKFKGAQLKPAATKATTESKEGARARLPSCGGRAYATGDLRGFFFCGGYEFGVGAFEVFDFVGVEMPDAGGDLVDYVVVVGYQQDCAVVFLQRDV